MKIRHNSIRRFLNRLSKSCGLSWIAFPVLPADNRVLFFKRDRMQFGFLSNFYPCQIQLDGRSWPNVEAYYQSRKSDNPKYHAEILRKKHASWAKYVGDSRIGDPELARKSWFRKHPEDLCEDWDNIKLDVMKKALEAKFKQNKDLQAALLNTLPAELIEDSPRNSFWGIGNSGKGENMLGLILMEIREDLANS